MAAAEVPGRPLTLEDVNGLYLASGEGPLPALQYFGKDADQYLWRVMVYVARLRADGFMMVVPTADAVVDFFNADQQQDVFAVHDVAELVVETTRGRQAGTLPALLVDVPTSSLGDFRRTIRGSSALPLHKFEFEGTTVRPNRAAVAVAAEAWISQTMDEDTAGEYGTAASEGNGGEAEWVALVEHQQALAEVQRLQMQLDAAQAQPRQPVQTGAVQAPARSGLLGSVANGPAADTTLEKLRMMAGPAPSRIGQAERMARTQNADGPYFETLQQEQSLEALDGEELDDLTLAQAAAASDPTQKLVLLQMQHLRLLTRQLASKQPQDAIQAALGSGSDGGSSSSAGIKGCLAREAFVKMSNNLVNLAQTVEQNALMELGLSSDAATPGLLREYVEKRVPLGNMRLLTQVSYLAAHAWEIGAKTANREMQGFAAKMMCFAEQTALDEGKTGLSWLLTGLPEPNYAVTQKNLVRYGAKP